MKKILLSLFAVGMMLTSCDMDLNAPGTVPDTEAFQTADDALGFRNNVYSSFRALTSGSYVTDVELEMDQFVGVLDNGSRGLTFSNATINSSTSDVSSNYSGCYSVMKNVNYMLEESQRLLDEGTMTAEDTQNVKRYMAEMKFMRAYIYYWLFDHYCQAYSADKANTEGLGLQLVTKYAPSSDQSTYPGRSTMAETIALINNDLTDAFNGLNEYQTENTNNGILVPCSPYVNTYTVAALQSRVALLTGDNQTAIDKANYVINSGVYALATGQDYIDMWSTDESTELIFVPFVDASEAAYVGSFMNAWAYTSNIPTRVDYVPTWSTVFMYDPLSEDLLDVRFDAFIDLQTMNIGGTVTAGFTFNKFPGNESLISGSNEYKNKPKPFRLSELYLIAAEAAQASGQETLANKMLNDIRKARIEGYTEEQNSGVVLRDAIRQERAKELIGEGFRMSDLRRWGLGFKRDATVDASIFEMIFPGYELISDFYIPSTTGVEFTAGDYRYVWPIPSDEMQVTPALKGQQNPGY